MQHRYTGDIGDYLKFALLRALPDQLRLAVCWWLHPDESHNDDGRHVTYIDQASRWQALDPKLYARLSAIVRAGVRSVHEIERLTLTSGTFFHAEAIPIGRTRSAERPGWLSRLQSRARTAEVLFLDPDNGIDLHPDADRRCSAKHVTLKEIAQLLEGGQTLIVYHHQTRAKGGHSAEIGRIVAMLAGLRLGQVTAIRAKPFSPRVFFIIGPNFHVHEALASFAQRFPGIYEVYQEAAKKIAVAGSQPWSATVITLYPEMFPGPLGVSLAGRALAERKWSLDTVQIRDFAIDRHRTVDDTPAGGGAGMVLRADVLAAAIDHALGRQPGCPVLAMTPRGRPLTQARVRELAAGQGVTVLCGRFEGFDERIFAGRPVEEVAVGDIVLSGGEPAAIMLLDACIRLLPGVMGAAASGTEESFEDGLLEYPHYTRPAEWEGRAIPEVLRSGDHAKIAAWRRRMAEADTEQRRPDLWERYSRD